MFFDSFLEVSAAQAFGAAAVSTNSIDLGLPGGLGTPLKRQIATGEPMGFGFACTTSGTVAATLLEVITTTDAALTAGILTVGQLLVPLANMVAGSLFFVPIAQGGALMQRFLGVRATTAGGTVSLTAWLSTHSMFSLIPASYAKAYLVD
jgi:hypothetical protein